MKRATMSFVLPAANGTMSRIGFTGYCASAGAATANQIAYAIRPLRTMDLMCPLLGQTIVHASFG
jgi:hypothetical protein